MAFPFSTNSPLVDCNFMSLGPESRLDEPDNDYAPTDPYAWMELSPPEKASNLESSSTDWLEQFDAALDAAESHSTDATVEPAGPARTPLDPTPFTIFRDELPSGPSIDTQVLWPSVELSDAGRIDATGSPSDGHSTKPLASSEEAEPIERTNRRVPVRRRRTAQPYEILAKDEDGYAYPLALYTRLGQQPKIPTKTFDRLVAPSSDGCVVSGSRRRCRFSRDLQDGEWIDREARCDTWVDGWESYRRHVIQMHLDLPRCNGVSQIEQIARRLEAICKKAAAAKQASSSRPSTSSDAAQTSIARNKRRKRDAEEQADETADDRVGKRARRE